LLNSATTTGPRQSLRFKAASTGVPYRVRPRQNGVLDPAHYDVTFTYTGDGKSYDGGLESPVEVHKHDTLHTRYNPKHPERNNTDPYPHWTAYDDLAFVPIDLGLFLYLSFQH
jgi:hypothetical protein